MNRWKITQFNPNLILIIILIINGLVVGMAILTDLIWKHTNGSIWTQDEAQYTRKFKKSRQNEKKTRDMKGIIKISQNYFLDIFHFPYIYKFLLKIFWKYFVKLFHLISRVIFFGLDILKFSDLLIRTKSKIRTCWRSNWRILDHFWRLWCQRKAKWYLCF